MASPWTHVNRHSPDEPLERQNAIILPDSGEAIASLIAVAAITAMGKVGGKISNVLTNVSNAMT